MRISKDLYKLENGVIVSVGQNETAPINSKLWCGYDYVAQLWVFEGKKDTRTLEELKASIGK